MENTPAIWYHKLIQMDKFHHHYRSCSFPITFDDVHEESDFHYYWTDGVISRFTHKQLAAIILDIGKTYLYIIIRYNTNCYPKMATFYLLFFNCCTFSIFKLLIINVLIFSKTSKVFQNVNLHFSATSQKLFFQKNIRFHFVYRLFSINFADRKEITRKTWYRQL